MELKCGVASHDTFSNGLRAIDPKGLDAASGILTATLLKALADGGVIAFDGKVKGGKVPPEIADHHDFPGIKAFGARSRRRG